MPCCGRRDGYCVEEEEGHDMILERDMIWNGRGTCSGNGEGHSGMRGRTCELY